MTVGGMKVCNRKSNDNFVLNPHYAIDFVMSVQTTINQHLRLAEHSTAMVKRLM